jgi:hypothetical protein
MIRNAMEYVADLVSKAGAVSIKDEPKLRKVFVRFGENLDIHDYPPVPRRADVRTLDDVAVVCGDAAIAPDPEVWVDECGVQIILDRKDRHEAIGMPLGRTCVRAVLETLEDTPYRDGPRNTVKMLRMELGGVPAIEQALARVDFSNAVVGTAVTEHGKESFGREVEAKVLNVDTIPRSFEIEFQVWQGLDYRRTIICLLYIDVAAELIEIRPAPDQLTGAINDAVDELIGDLRQAVTCPVFGGDPSP